MSPPFDATAPMDATHPVVHQVLLQALMDRVECGLFALDVQGRLLHGNAAASRSLAGDGLLRLEHGVVVTTPSLRERWADALLDAALRGRNRLVCLDEADQCLLVALMPVQEGMGAEGVALAMTGRHTVCSPLGLEMFAISQGLTLAEQRVLRALVDNRSARQIADSHGVALTTVRTQIQTLRDKIGVRSIDELLLRAASLPPVRARC